MASVRKRKWVSAGEEKTAWVVDYFDQNNKRHLKTFAKKKDADAYLVQSGHEVSQGTHTAQSSTLTVAEAAELWLEHCELEGCERSTLKQYRNHVKHHLSPLIGGARLAKLTTPAIEAFRDDLLRKGSRAMAKKVLASLKSIIGEAQRRGLIAQNVARTVKVKVDKREKRKLLVGRDIPSKAEINAIIGAAAGRWRPLLLAAIFTGMRSSELRGLTWDAVDFEAKVIHVRQRADLWGVIGAPKSEAGDREIPMGPTVVNALKEWKLACPRPFKADGKSGKERTREEKPTLVFPNGDGNVESHANIANRGFYALQLKAGIATQDKAADGSPAVDDEGEPIMSPKYGMHALRHFYASWIIEQGFSPKRAQQLLGHSSIQMTFDVYGHLFPSIEDDHAKLAAGELALAK